MLKFDLKFFFTFVIGAIAGAVWVDVLNATVATVIVSSILSGALGALVSRD